MGRPSPNSFDYKRTSAAGGGGRHPFIRSLSVVYRVRDVLYDSGVTIERDDAGFGAYRDALMQALAGDGAVGDGEPLAVLRHVTSKAMAVAAEGPGRDEVGTLQRVAGA